MNRSAQRVRRLLPFDGLRGIAAVGVTAFHVNPMSPFLFWAWSFVDMFFVLSGFLIGTILQRGISEGNFSLKNFWIRRILRIWPVYYLTLALVVVWALLSPALHLSPKALIQSLFFLQFTGAYLHPGADWNSMVWQFLPWFSHSWSIAVEEQFYLLLPVLFWLVGVRARSIFLLVIVALSVSQWLLCANLVPHLLGTRMQGLALGLLLVPLSRWLDPSSDASSQKHRRATLVLLAASLFTGFCVMAPRCAAIFPKLWSGEAVGADTFKDLVLTGALGMSLIYFALVGFVVAFPHGVLSRLLSTPLLVYLGGISYALYMCHVPVEGLLVMLRGRPLAADSLLVVGIYWIVVLALATFSRIFIEDRFNALKERYPVFTKAT